MVSVLIIDESAPARDALGGYLHSIGCRVVAESGSTAQALELFRATRPALVVLDIAVPRAGGLDALSLFRQMRKEAPRMPILVVTAAASREVRRIFIREGALDYLVKPLDGASLEWMRRRLENNFSELEARSTRPMAHAHA